MSDTSIYLQPSRRRGAAYLVALGASLVVMLAGVAALTAVRVQRRAAVGDEHRGRARLHAQSGTELALLILQSDADWRSRYTNDAWTTDRALGDGAFAFKLVDEQDGDLADDFSEPVRLHVRGSIGDAIRLHSLQLNAEPDAASANNPLSNGHFESGAGGWIDFAGNATLATTTTNPHSGNRALRVSSRSGTDAAVATNVESFLQSGQPYEGQAWVRMDSGVDEVRLALRTRTLLLVVDYVPMTDWTPVGTEWTHLSGRATPSWLNLLDSAHFIIETRNTATTFYVDDAILARQGKTPSKPAPVAGTWRREVLP